MNPCTISMDEISLVIYDAAKDEVIGVEDLVIVNAVNLLLHLPLCSLARGIAE